MRLHNICICIVSILAIHVTASDQTHVPETTASKDTLSHLWNGWGSLATAAAIYTFEQSIQNGKPLYGMISTLLTNFSYSHNILKLYSNTETPFKSGLTVALSSSASMLGWMFHRLLSKILKNPIYSRYQDYDEHYYGHDASFFSRHILSGCATACCHYNLLCQFPSNSLWEQCYSGLVCSAAYYAFNKMLKAVTISPKHVIIDPHTIWIYTRDTRFSAYRISPNTATFSETLSHLQTATDQYPHMLTSQAAYNIMRNRITQAQSHGAPDQTQTISVTDYRPLMCGVPHLRTIQDRYARQLGCNGMKVLTWPTQYVDYRSNHDDPEYVCFTGNHLSTIFAEIWKPLASCINNSSQQELTRSLNQIAGLKKLLHTSRPIQLREVHEYIYNDECPICLETISEDNYYRFSCHHGICTECWENFANMNRRIIGRTWHYTCPWCRNMSEVKN